MGCDMLNSDSPEALCFSQTLPEASRPVEVVPKKGSVVRLSTLQLASESEQDPVMAGEARERVGGTEMQIQWVFAASGGYGVDTAFYGEVKAMVQKLHR